MAGFDTTQSIALGAISAFGASRVHAALYATQSDGMLKTYAGHYTGADGILVDASNRRSRWRSAKRRNKSPASACSGCSRTASIRAARADRAPPRWR